MMALTLDDLFASPDHYLHSFEGESAVFVPMDRTAFHRSIFLDGRISPAGNGTMRLPLSAFAGPIPRPRPTNWIFHVAHCGSTLLARALDRPEANLVLREPLALRQLALSPDSRRLAVTATMLSKRYRAEAPTIVKANVPVNFMLAELIPLAPDSRAIFLYLGLRDYLLAILRNEKHRAWLRKVTTDLSSNLGDLSGAADADRAAALWLAQMRAFEAAIARMPHGRSLDAETFFAEPRRIVTLAAAHLDAPFTNAEVAALVEGPLFATYSKNPELPFDNETRLARRNELERTIAGELSQAERWIDKAGPESKQAIAAVSAAALGN
jgi:hypothetical protein